MTIDAKWIDTGRTARQPSNPQYPEGKDLDMTGGVEPCCSIALPYPARRCGYFKLSCGVCGLTALVTTAGRADDPRSVKLACRMARP